MRDYLAVVSQPNPMTSLGLVYGSLKQIASYHQNLPELRVGLLLRHFIIMTVFSQGMHVSS